MASLRLAVVRNAPVVASSSRLARHVTLPGATSAIWELHRPMAEISARHGSTYAQSATPSKALGREV